MTNSQATPGRGSASARHPRPRTATKPVTRLESLDLRELLEANLAALRALHEEHRQMLERSLRAIDSASAEIRADLRALANTRTPWVQAMSDSRALMYVALRELIVGAHEAELSRHMPKQAPTDSHDRSR
jgi:hypothetical protein